MLVMYSSSWIVSNYQQLDTILFGPNGVIENGWYDLVD